MKRIYFLPFICLFALLIACGDDPPQEDPAENTEEAAAELEEDIATGSNSAICLWPKVGLREKPGGPDGNKYLVTIKFGETVELLGETEETGGRTYMKVRSSDEKEGWLREDLFAHDAYKAVVMTETEVYNKPDIMEYDGKKLNKGDVVTVSNTTKGEWREILGMEKKPKGWVEGVSNLGTDNLDVGVAMLYHRAMKEDKKSARKKALENLVGNSRYGTSTMISLANDALADMEEPERPALPANQAYITADNLNVRSEPDNEADNVVFKVKDGDIVDIIEKGERQEIRDMNDYWYKIEFDGQEGWVYGHFTSKRLAN